MNTGSNYRKTRRYIRELQLFKVRQITRLLFAAWERLDRSDFTRVLKLVTVISFRYSVISDLNTNELEPVYHRAARNVFGGQARTPAEVFQLLKSIYVTDKIYSGVHQQGDRNPGAAQTSSKVHTLPS